MAKPIEIGTELKGQDAEDFVNYINGEHKELTPQAIECAKEALCQKCEYGELLPICRAEKKFAGAIITLPKECVGTRYARYINRKTGVITLIPTWEPEK